jgi:hypothetical protein
MITGCSVSFLFIPPSLRLLSFPCRGQRRVSFVVVVVGSVRTRVRFPPIIHLRAYERRYETLTTAITQTITVLSVPR